MFAHSLAAIAIVASSLIVYNGHAGLGANVTDGTSNTIMFGERAAADSRPGAFILMTDSGGQF